MKTKNPPDPWIAESEAIAESLDDRDYDVAYSAELATELGHHAAAASVDEFFEQQFAEWLEYVSGGPAGQLLLGLEQSCSEGILLAWDMRGVRLATAPAELLARLHWLFQTCPRHVLAHLANFAYWLVRCERARRRGSPDWSPNMALSAGSDYKHEPAFRPRTLRPIRWP